MESGTTDDQHDERGCGTGLLSTQARERLARPPVPPLRPPPPDDRPAVADWRSRIHAAWLDGDPSPQACGHRGAVIAGVACLVAEARVGVEDAPTIVYCHGGGYALGSPRVAVPITERLAHSADLISIDYRLAPEHPYPAAVEDCFAVFDHVRAQRRAVAIAGDSAGANLALACTLLARDRGEAGPEALVLLSPHLDLHPADGPESKSDREDVDGEAGRWLREAYCADRSPSDPEVSPLRADLGGLPPTLVQVGSDDSALADAARFARRARFAGSTVTLDVWSGLWHTWHYHRNLPEADLALSEAADFVVRAVAAGRRPAH